MKEFSDVVSNLQFQWAQAYCDIDFNYVSSSFAYGINIVFQFKNKKFHAKPFFHKLSLRVNIRETFRYRKQNKLRHRKFSLKLHILPQV